MLESEELFMKAICYVGTAIGIIVIFIVINYLFNLLYRKKFESKYEIKIDNKFKVRKNRKNLNINKFELVYPRWTYSNKNGSRNRVRKNNYLVYYYSILYFNEFTIKTKSPVNMIDLVKAIRDKYGDNIIEKNNEEIIKYAELKKKKDLITKTNEIQTIIDEFADDPSKFENFCSELFIKMGYKANVTPKTNDGGYDIVLNKDSVISIVECKCYAQNHSVGRPLIQKLVGANQEVKANGMKFITTSKFSKEAISFANETGVELIDGKKLINFINEYYKKSFNPIVSREEWQLNYDDLQKHYPPDVNVL